MNNCKKLEFLKSQLYTIQELSKHDLDNYLQDMHLRNLPSDVLNYLHRAVDIRTEETSTCINEIEHSEITLEDIA